MNRDFPMGPRSVVGDLLAAVACLFAGACFAAELGRRPDFLIVLADDQGYGDVGVHGNQVIETPKLNFSTDLLA